MRLEPGAQVAPVLKTTHHILTVFILVRREVSEWKLSKKIRAELIFID